MPTYYRGGVGPQQTQVGTGFLAEKQGLANLLQMLQTQGRIDPRLMASLQAANARSTQQQQDAVRSRGGTTGMANSGLLQALMGSIGAAGANRAANIQYQDISDSYGRNQQNLGLMNQIVQQPNLGYAHLQNDNYWANKNNQQQNKAAQLAFLGTMFGSVGKAAGG